MSATLTNAAPEWTPERLTGFACALCFLAAAAVNVKASVFNRIDDVKAADSFRKRTIFCVSLQLNMFFISMLCSLLTLSDIDDVYVPWREYKVDVAKYGDWLTTCPMLQLIIIVFAGPDTDIYWPKHLFITALTIICGLLATFAETQLLRGAFFAVGCGCFLNVLYNMDFIIVQVSKKHASMSRGDHALRLLVLITAFTWLAFPILWLCSTDGFALLPDIALAFPIINVLSKVGFMFGFRWCLTRLVQEHTGEKDLTVTSMIRRNSVEDAAAVKRNSIDDTKDLESNPTTASDAGRGSQLERPRDSRDSYPTTAAGSRRGSTLREDAPTGSRRGSTFREDALTAGNRRAANLSAEARSRRASAEAAEAAGGTPCSEELQALLKRAMAAAGPSGEQEVDRVLEVLSREWVLSVPTLLDLRPEDLVRLGVPMGLVSAVRVELLKSHPVQAVVAANGPQPEPEGGFSLLQMCATQKIDSVPPPPDLAIATYQSEMAGLSPRALPSPGKYNI